ncbi:MAG: exodeoxyribonuclease VII small subunit [Mariprofundus sp.]|nr:exodeoxyribonuclease VII small subunit [Mariprofundus sp.]
MTKQTSAPSLSPKLPPKPSFEQALDGLTGLVEKLESGELPLEESVAAFEQGVKLSRRCETLLDQAEQRLQILDDDSDH